MARRLLSWRCSVWLPMLTSCSGVCEAVLGSRRHLFEVFASLSNRSTFDLVNRLVVNEFSLGFVREQAEKPNVGVGHGREPGSDGGIEMAAAWGRSTGRSSGPMRRKPNVLSRLVICCGGSPHSGQATRYAAAAGVKRSRQRGQQAWVITDPFRLKGVQSEG